MWSEALRSFQGSKFWAEISWKLVSTFFNYYQMKLKIDINQIFKTNNKAKNKVKKFIKEIKFQ